MSFVRLLARALPVIAHYAVQFIICAPPCDPLHEPNRECAKLRADMRGLSDGNLPRSSRFALHAPPRSALNRRHLYRDDGRH
jgi:hypothetical protein